MKHIITLALVLGASFSFGQEEPEKLNLSNKNGDEKAISYSVISDKPRNLKLAALSIPIWNGTASPINSSLYDANVAGTFHFLNFQVAARYKFGLGDKLLPDSYEFSEYPNQDHIYSVNKAQKAQEFNLITTYFFNLTESKGEARIHLKTSGNTSYVTDVPVTFLKKIGFNVGYTQGFTWYNMNRMDLSAEFVEIPGEVRTFSSLASMSSMQTYKFIKTGITYTRAFDFKGNFEGYGNRQNSEIKTTYFNVMFAVQNEFDDVYAPVGATTQNNYYYSSANERYVSRASIDKQNKKLAIGAEFGQNFMSKKSGVSMNYAVKYLPGFVKNINFALELGIGYTFNFLAKR